MTGSPLDPGDARRMLAAYESPEAVLVAAIVIGATGGGRAGGATDRRLVEDRWAARMSTGRQITRDKVRNALRIMEVAGMLRRDAHRVIVADPARLAMAAANMRIMYDPGSGAPIPRNMWSGIPDVPDELIAAQLDRINGARCG